MSTSASKIKFSCSCGTVLAVSPERAGSTVACPKCARSVAVPAAGGASWYVARKKQKSGPYPSAQLKRMAASGLLLPDDMLLREGQKQWVKAATVRGLFPELVPAGAAPDPRPVSGPPPRQPKRRGVRREDADDRDDDRPRRSNPKTLSILGLISLIGGILSLLFSFIPCIGVLGILGGLLGLLLGGIGLRVAGASNHGKGLPVAGLVVNLLSLVVAGAWLAFLASVANNAQLSEVETADPIRISAAQLCRDYDSNEVRADATYKGKVVEVTGQVKLVSKERVGRITVELGSREDTVDCDFGSATQADLAGIELGQTVTIRGKCKGVDRESEYVVLESCKKVDQGPTGETVRVEAGRLLDEYDADDGAANKAYKGKVVEVTGRVSEVEKDDGNELVLLFRAKKEVYLECRLTPEASRAAGAVRKGEQVTVRGTCAGLQEDDRSVLVENAVLVK